MAVFRIRAALLVGTVADRSGLYKRCRPAFSQSSPGIRRSRHGGQDRAGINGGAAATGEPL
jgi:hypothetical protein